MAVKSRHLTVGQGWSLETGCQACGRFASECRCPKDAPVVTPQRQQVRLRLEKRRGKPLTVAAGLVLPAAEMKELLRELKNFCGAGGTLKDGELEIQGDQRDVLRAHLEGKGYRVKGG
jgi:translation initiation factor 1